MMLNFQNIGKIMFYKHFTGIKDYTVSISPSLTKVWIKWCKALFQLRFKLQKQPELLL